MRDCIGEHQESEGVARSNSPPRSASYPMGEDQKTNDRQSQQRYPDWERKLKLREAHRDHRRVI